MLRNADASAVLLCLVQCGAVTPAIPKGLVAKHHHMLGLGPEVRVPATVRSQRPGELGGTCATGSGSRLTPRGTASLGASSVQAGRLTNPVTFNSSRRSLDRVIAVEGFVVKDPPVSDGDQRRDMSHQSLSQPIWPRVDADRSFPGGTDRHAISHREDLVDVEALLFQQRFAAPKTGDGLCDPPNRTAWSDGIGMFDHAQVWIEKWTEVLLGRRQIRHHVEIAPDNFLDIDSGLIGATAWHRPIITQLWLCVIGRNIRPRSRVCFDPARRRRESSRAAGPPRQRVASWPRLPHSAARRCTGNGYRDRRRARRHPAGGVQVGQGTHRARSRRVRTRSAGPEDSTGPAHRDRLAGRPCLAHDEARNRPAHPDSPRRPQFRAHPGSSKHRYRCSWADRARPTPRRSSAQAHLRLSTRAARDARCLASRSRALGLP